MKSFNYAALLLLVLLYSCDGSTYKKRDTDFKDNRWPRHAQKTFEFDVTDRGAYDLYLLFSYVEGVQFAEIPIVFEWRRPDGMGMRDSILLLTKDTDGKELGDCTGDLCDLEQTIFKGQVLAPGKYTVKLSNDFNHEYLPNVTAVGIRLNKNGK